MKYNRATTLGFRLYRFSSYQVHNGVAIDTLMETINKWKA